MSELKKLEEIQKLERAHEEREMGRQRQVEEMERQRQVEEMERQRQVEEMERQRRMEAKELERQKQLLTVRAELQSLLSLLQCVAVNSQAALVIDLKPSEKLHDIIKDSFEIENYGVSLVEDDNVKSVEDEKALKILEDTTKKVGDRYESGLLWNLEDFIYPLSYENALKRLKGIEMKMARDENFHNKYKAKITDYEEKGYIRKLRDDEANVINYRTYYLPHFGVINPNKPDKLRLVFDAAAKANGWSFNDGLLSGPDLLNPLPAVLLKFRLRKFAIAGDIQEMFHQVRIRKEDVDSQRFLWREDPNNEPDTYIMEAMIFGSTCSPSTALYVVNSNAKRFLQIYPEASKAILCSEYMDDLLDYRRRS
ncbi:uncharacterized protein LOC128987889 [Macrosteles quadrilineatus]|uniref:uncharacterized protein LOC128987889 n=1 Tax=Macrosteles quadrilineatus TaxID=74068 RepID=UPI0023E19CA1|nr:uncharacterized protein LOC128987889 [Macrosteles quadrilineatus]